MRTKCFLLIAFFSFFLVQQTTFSEEISKEQWISIPVYGPGIMDILVKTSDSKTAYIIAYQRLFKTQNGGLSWEHLCVTNPERKDQCLEPLLIAEAPISLDNIYIGTKAGLFRSDDGGKTWTNLGAGIIKDVSWIKVIDSLKIYVLSREKLFKTMNGGKSWGDITPPDGISYVAMHSKTEEIITIKDRIVYPSTIYCSEDGGLSWQENIFKTYSCKRWINLKINPLDDKLFFALCDGNPPDLIKSFDGGNTWEKITPTKNNVKLLPFKGIRANYLELKTEFDIFFDLNDQNSFYITGFWGRSDMGSLDNGFLKTSDGGRTYEFHHINGTNMNVRKIRATSDPLTTYASTSQGAYKTIDGGKSWRPINSGLFLGRSDAMRIDRSWLYLDRENYDIYHIIQWGYQQHAEVAIYKSEDGGLTWEEHYRDRYRQDYENRNAYLFYANPILILGQKEYILGSVKSKTIKNRELGSSEWKTIKTNVSHPLFFYVSKSNPKNMYLIDKEDLNISEDEGFSWFSIKFPGVVRMANILDDGSSKPKIYVLGEDRQLYKTSDEGVNWIKVTPEAVQWFDKETKAFKNIHLGKNVTTFAIDQKSTNSIFLGTEGIGVIRSSNGGKTWDSSNEGLGTSKNISISSIAIDPKNPNVVYVGTKVGVFKSLDKGATWKPFSNGLPDSDREIKTIRINNSNPQLFVMETQANIYRLMDASLLDLEK